MPGTETEWEPDPRDARDFFGTAALSFKGFQRPSLWFTGSIPHTDVPCSIYYRDTKDINPLRESPEGPVRFAVVNLPGSFVDPPQGRALQDLEAALADPEPVLGQLYTLRESLAKLETTFGLELRITSYGAGQGPMLVIGYPYAGDDHQLHAAIMTEGIASMLYQFDRYTHTRSGDRHSAVALFGEEELTISTTSDHPSHTVPLIGYVGNSRTPASVMWQNGRYLQINIGADSIDPVKGARKLRLFDTEGQFQNELRAIVEGIPFADPSNTKIEVRGRGRGGGYDRAFIRLEMTFDTNLAQSRTVQTRALLREVLDYFDNRISDPTDIIDRGGLTEATFEARAVQRDLPTLKQIWQQRVLDEAEYFTPRKTARPGVPWFQDTGTELCVRIQPSSLHSALNWPSQQELFTEALSRIDEVREIGMYIHLVRDILSKTEAGAGTPGEESEVRTGDLEISDLAGRSGDHIAYWDIRVPYDATRSVTAPRAPDQAATKEDALFALDALLRDYWHSFASGILPADLDNSP